MTPRRTLAALAASTITCSLLAAACGSGLDDAHDGGDTTPDAEALPDDRTEVDAAPGDGEADAGDEARDVEDAGADADADDGAEDVAPLPYPGATWERRSPAEVGLDEGALGAYGGYVGGRGVVVRGGYLVHTWGDPADRGDIASAVKPFYSHFLLVAVEQGRLAGIDDLVDAHEPRLDDLNAGLGHKDREIRWRHLANQTSCYGVRERPGEAFDYSDYNMALFFDTLLLSVYGSTWDRVDADVLHPLLTDVLQCEDGPTFLAFGTGDRPGRMAISARDFARFGLLYLRGGRWRDVPVLRPEPVALATTSPVPNAVPRTGGAEAEMIPGQRSIGGGNNQTDHLGSYSFAWWINGVDRGGERHWPDAPLDAYGAFGHGGPRAMVVIPSLDLVTSWNDATVDSRERENEALRLLVAAVL